ncbi:hypothetical protein CN643_03720 [Parageobacillus yumthangensis]|nr:hypothetical protein CN643_03720 [Parageobacillus yumthangensis]
MRLTPPNHTKRAFFIQVPEKTSNRNAPLNKCMYICKDVSMILYTKVEIGWQNNMKKLLLKNILTKHK